MDILTETHHSSSRVAQALAGRAKAADIVVHEGPLEYSGGLPFYMRRRVHILNGRRGDLNFGSRYPEAKLFFLDDSGFVELWRSARQVFLVTRLQEKERVLDRLCLGTAHLVGRYGSRSLYSNHGS